MAQALTAYRELQTALDQSMPDQIIEIQGRQFRKKGYWRAIAVAFNLSVDLVEERRDVRGVFDDGQDNFGYFVTCRATAPNGRTAIGDGSVFAIEKARRDVADKWATLPAQATEHNIRSHAVTRATNRAISNLCGFGEVSAEEADQDDASVQAPAQRRPSAARLITPGQQKRFFAIANTAGWKDRSALRDELSQKFHVRETAKSRPIGTPKSANTSRTRPRQ